MSKADDLIKAQAKLEALRDLERDGLKIPTTTMQAAEKAAGVYDANKFRVTSAQLADPLWMYANQAKLSEAIRADNWDIIDD